MVKTPHPRALAHTLFKPQYLKQEPMSPARRWVRNDVVFAAVALGLVALTYTPLVRPLNGLLGAVSFHGADWVLHALDVSHITDAREDQLHRGGAHRGAMQLLRRRWQGSDLP